MACGDTRLQQMAAWLVALPMRRTFATAQTRIRERSLILLRVSAEGQEGWGEAAPVPGHGSEDASEIWGELRRMAAVPGGDVPVPATGLLAAAFRQACDDLEARLAGQPLVKWIGGTGRAPAGAAVGVDSDDQPHADQLAAAAAAGYRYAKLKITPNTDVSRVAALMAEYPDIGFGADANGSLPASEERLLFALDELGLIYVEQPGPAHDLQYHAEMRRRLSTPIALDESAATVPAIDAILAQGAADIINLKAGRFGTTATVELAKRITSTGARVRIGGLLESGVGRAHTVAAAAHPLFTVPGDLAGSDRYFADDLVRPQWLVSDGSLAPSSHPGIGVEVDLDALRRFSTDRHSVRGEATG